MKIILINHTFQIPRFYKRWEMLAKSNPELDVTLIAPAEYKWDIKGSMIFGEDTKLIGEKIQRSNFRIIPVAINNIKYVGWVSQEMNDVIKKISPDFIYHIGAHNQLSLHQCLYLKKKLRNTKVMAFSMRGPTMDLHLPTMKRSGSLVGYVSRLIAYPLRKAMLNYFNKKTDAVLCHYPDAYKCFREEGYRGPIYLSTQVGVDTDQFYPNEEYRREIQAKYDITDEFVFGTAARFIPDKGLEDIIMSFPKEGNWKCLMMGKGSEEFTQKIKSLIDERNLNDKIILTGYVNAEEMPKYWNAVDCAIHVPRTTLHWQETFSLAIVQAMACGKPVIGNTSGSVPYQIGKDELIIKEGDNQELHNKILWMLKHRDLALNLGSLEMERAQKSFAIKHLNSHFIHIIEELQTGKYDKSKYDMALFQD